MPSKRELRTFVRQQKAAHTPDTLRTLSEQACRGVCRLAVWQRAKAILLYHPLPDEVDVTPLAAAACEQGKRIYLPVVTGPESIEIRRWTPDTAMQTGSFGIQEPAGNEASPQEYAGIQLAIVPGMGFDRAGHRLGRGKGYYDRLLATMPRAQRVGVCFPFQMLGSIPSEHHDVAMHLVVWGDTDESTTAGTPV